jgi:2-amino-4-hydroxy-6-hydroxymethyldihydropteridine diphosphokinase
MMTVLALGSNLALAGQTPSTNVERGLQALTAAGVAIRAVAPIIMTTPLPGGGRQPAYANTVALVEVRVSPAMLLRLLKRIERQAGRRTRRRWGPRPLDIDIIAMGPASSTWPRRRIGSVTVPHPETHRRAFVLAPLLAVAPQWRHPALGAGARHLLMRLPTADRLDVGPLRRRPAARSLGPEDRLG